MNFRELMKDWFPSLAMAVILILVSSWALSGCAQVQDGIHTGNGEANINLPGDQSYLSSFGYGLQFSDELYLEEKDAEGRIVEIRDAKQMGQAVSVLTIEAETFKKDINIARHEVQVKARTSAQRFGAEDKIVDELDGLPGLEGYVVKHDNPKELTTYWRYHMVTHLGQIITLTINAHHEGSGLTDGAKLITKIPGTMRGDVQAPEVKKVRFGDAQVRAGRENRLWIEAQDDVTGIHSVSFTLGYVDEPAAEANEPRVYRSMDFEGFAESEGDGWFSVPFTPSRTIPEGTLKIESLIVEDRSQNTSADPIELEELPEVSCTNAFDQDATPPMISGLLIPETFVGGQNNQIRVQAFDDLGVAAEVPTSVLLTDQAVEDGEFNAERLLRYEAKVIDLGHDWYGIEFYLPEWSNRENLRLVSASIADLAGNPQVIELENAGALSYATRYQFSLQPDIDASSGLVSYQSNKDFTSPELTSVAVSKYLPGVSLEMTFTVEESQESPLESIEPLTIYPCTQDQKWGFLIFPENIESVDDRTFKATADMSAYPYLPQATYAFSRFELADAAGNSSGLSWEHGDCGDGVPKFDSSVSVQDASGFIPPQEVQ